MKVGLWEAPKRVKTGITSWGFHLAIGILVLRKCISPISPSPCLHIYRNMTYLFP